MSAPSQEELGGFGFAEPARAARSLAALSVQLSERDAASALEAARASPSPDACLAALERCAPALARLSETARAELLPSLAAAIDASDLTARLISARSRLPAWLYCALSAGRRRPPEALNRKAVAAATRSDLGEREALPRRLRRLKYRELLRIVAREALLLGPPDELGKEMSHLAQACVQAALTGTFRELRQRFGAPEGQGLGFCVFGLGKLGGEDLNFSSDVDLIYLYREEGQTSGGFEGSLSHAQFFAKLAEGTTRALSAVTGDGFCFRVDLNLRPAGRGGAIVLSLAQTVGYYETQGRTWERAALIKARPIAGELALGEELLQQLAPFLFPRSLDLAAVDELRELKHQIDLRGKASAADLKLGQGGIREIEFFANALQLLHGGKRPSLRERNTVRALRKLEQAGLLSAPDADALEEAYLFLRRAENRLQMLEERQIHSLPEAPLERARLARGLGFQDWAGFLGELERHRAYVRGAFSTLLGQTAREEVPDEPLLALALDLDAPEAERSAALEERGFADPDRALAAIGRLARSGAVQFTQGPSGPGLEAVRLLAEVARTPDPDQALQLFAEFVSVLVAPQGYLGLLAAAPSASRRLLNLFGQSEYLSRYFLRHPELLDALVQPAFEEVHKEPERIRAELSARVHRHSDSEARLSAMRRCKNEEVLRIGLYDIAGELEVPEVSRQLTALADGAIDEALFLALAEADERYGRPTGGARPSLAVVGMGKLGGRELGYHSDLDLIFVYSGSGDEETEGGSKGRLSHHEYFAKVVQRLLTFLSMQLREGALYKVDTRLRPSGNQGPLVVNQASLRDHHEKRAKLWERQALIKAREVAGDFSLGRRLVREIIEPLVYLRPLPPDAAAEIDRMRMRMEREVAREGGDQLNPKVGQGGLVDVEFAVQYLQLLHGAAHPEARTASTLEALSALEEQGCLPAADARALREGYLFHRRVENRLRLVHGYSLSSMPTEGRPLSLLARRLGYLGSEPGRTFLEEYRSWAGRVREVYRRILRIGARGFPSA
ncbi:MAG: bifunctional [glutamate--ammonia ligase]-adenylyl-L-tyrosine phosphorylase/[glutamate--ammonia-ligase] adenylyltransferase [Myxococcales bacterium]|nr:bifunctional [glutamate--ammonia ligase]-adenylyl-L-tyrosine phosphorylase/[glutamate--ammonia-ligase] adenylyltransferase [Myxococcales bacterium]